jgi:hypothetical protein
MENCCNLSRGIYQLDFDALDEAYKVLEQGNIVLGGRKIVIKLSKSFTQIYPFRRKKTKEIILTTKKTIIIIKDTDVTGTDLREKNNSEPLI